MTFTEATARAVLAQALPQAAPRAELLSLGENAVFATAATVVKIGRDASLLARAEREVRVAGRLAALAVPAVRPARDRAESVAGHPVTHWHRLPPAVRDPGGADLAALLRAVHALSGSSFEPPGLPRRDLLDGVERWLRSAGEAIDPADAAFLRQRRDELAAALPTLVPRLTPGPVHGDALPRNVHVGPDGPVLTDLETFADDLREHDLVVMALAADRYGMPAAEYDAFCEAYGWDVREWEGCAVLRGARETASCAWVAQHAPANPAALAEFRRRVASLRTGDTGVRWHAF